MSTTECGAFAISRAVRPRAVGREGGDGIKQFSVTHPRHGLPPKENTSEWVVLFLRHRKYIYTYIFVCVCVCTHAETTHTLELLKKRHSVLGPGPKRLCSRTHTHTHSFTDHSLEIVSIYYILRFNLHVSLVFVHIWEYNSQTSVYLKFRPIRVLWCGTYTRRVYKRVARRVPWRRQSKLFVLSIRGERESNRRHKLRRRAVALPKNLSTVKSNRGRF